MRTAIRPHWVTVEDNRTIGDAYEVMTEDGPVVRLPPSLPIIVLTLEARCGHFDEGSRFYHACRYGSGPAEWDRACRALQTIQLHGSVNLDSDRWVMGAAVYGSVAYFTQGYHEMDKRIGD